jgi:hypothetical protein
MGGGRWRGVGGGRLDREIRIGDSTHSRRDPLALFVEGSSDTHISPLLTATDRYAIRRVQVTGPPFILIVCRGILPIHTFHSSSAPQTGMIHICGVRVTGPPFILIVCREILPIHTFHRFSAPQTGMLHTVYAGCE